MTRGGLRSGAGAPRGKRVTTLARTPKFLRLAPTLLAAVDKVMGQGESFNKFCTLAISNEVDKRNSSKVKVS